VDRAGLELHVVMLAADPSRSRLADRIVRRQR
jgi:hypothetical protein